MFALKLSLAILISMTTKTELLCLKKILIFYIFRSYKFDINSTFYDIVGSVLWSIWSFRETYWSIPHKRMKNANKLRIILWSIEMIELFYNFLTIWERSSHYPQVSIKTKSVKHTPLFLTIELYWRCDSIYTLE